MAQESTVTYEELIQLEYEFDDVDLQILRQQYQLSKPLYKKRQALISKIENFWPLVFEQSPPEVDQYIQPSDSQVFAECLKGLEVERFEIDAEPNSGMSPRSFSIRMEFADNEWFEDKVLEKKFYYRRASDGWTGLVSEPVKIHWKDGKDLTGGLTDAAVKLWEATQKAANGAAEGKTSSQRAEVMKLLEKSQDGPPSFFTLFGFVSERRYVTAEESAEATKAEIERRKKKAAGEQVEDVEQEEGDEHMEVEVCNYGDDLATVLAEDVWPNAIKYFTTAQEMDEDDVSEMDFEEEDDESDEELDIRSLVKGKRKGDRTGETPPSKARKA